MSKKTTNKSIVIVSLIVLLILLAIGYAAFSDKLIISGTATASGTFGLEFKNEALVEETSVGINKTNTTIVTSEDNKTLTVTVADLAYPGAGAEFTVDIVNVGSIPAIVNKVNVKNNITGNDVIKINGLEVISETHPTIEPHGVCNIHFTVVWPENSEIILTADNNTVKFDLEVEYVQDVGNGSVEDETSEDKKLFDGVPSHDGVVSKEYVLPKYPTIASQVTPEDYGKDVDYVAEVTEVMGTDEEGNSITQKTQVTDWQLFLLDEDYVYLIYKGYLPYSVVPKSAGLTKGSGSTGVSSYVSADHFISVLTDSSIWTEFASGIEGAVATGSPTIELFRDSFNGKMGTSYTFTHDEWYDSETDTVNEIPLLNEDGEADSLYVPFTASQNGVVGWRIASKGLSAGGDNNLMVVRNYGSMRDIGSSIGMYSIRPVIKLPITITGQVGDTIQLEIIQDTKLEDLAK